MDKQLFGWIASSITVIYKIPQIIKLYRTKKSSDLSCARSMIMYYINTNNNIKSILLIEYQNLYKKFPVQYTNGFIDKH